jgi:hypothetical protein
MDAVVEGVFRREENGALHFGNELVELSFDLQSGRWLSLTDRRDGQTVLREGASVAPILLTVDGHTESRRGYGQMSTLADADTIGRHWKLDAFSQQVDGDHLRLTIALAEGDWRVEVRYGLRPGRARVERGVRIEYVGDGEALLRHFVLRAPFATLGAAHDTRIDAPGYPMRPGRRVSHLPFGSWGQLPGGAFCDSPAWLPPLISLHNPLTRRALLVWSYTETEPFYPTVNRREPGVMLGHRVYLADRFRRGHALEWGAQYLELHHGEWMDALSRFQSFYDEAGLVVPADIPGWARACDMYEVHVGTLTHTKLAPFPTYDELIAALPRIRDKGFDVVYIMPHVPFPGYSVIDYLDVGIHQGSEAGFRAFIARAHELGLKVFMDVTMHGVLDRQARRKLGELDGRPPEAYPMDPAMPEVHPYLAEHPEWFSRNEYGEVAMTYTYAFDHASPAWQDFMAGVFRYYVEAYDVDGFRVDSHTWNFFPNWARGLPRPASRSFYGSVALFDRVRRELKTIKPEVVLYTETAGPLFCRSHELAYNYDETWLLLSMLPILSRRGLLCHFASESHVTNDRLTARDVARWLAERQLVFPRGAIKVRHLDCHDTYWRPKEFRSRTFGIPAARAIVAFFAFADGGFMDYEGADEGSEDFYRTVMHLRRTQPALKRGSCDYLAVRPDDEMALAMWRGHEGQVLVPVIYFDNKPARTELALPVERLDGKISTFELRDLLTDLPLTAPDGAVTWRRDQLDRLPIALEPYATLLLEIRPAR